MENMKGYYAQDCGPASHNQAMIADENDDKGRTVAVVYDREKARAIVKACNEYEELIHELRMADGLLRDLLNFKWADDDDAHLRECVNERLVAIEPLISG